MCLRKRLGLVVAIGASLRLGKPFRDFNEPFVNKVFLSSATSGILFCLFSYLALVESLHDTKKKSISIDDIKKKIDDHLSKSSIGSPFPPKPQ